MDMIQYLTDYSIEESLSGDGLIVANLLGDRDLILPEVSLNYSSALFFDSRYYVK